MKETDMYRPVYDFLAAQGYTVRSEVRGCDLVAVRGDEILAFEFKKAFGLRLLEQAVERQRSSDSVYVVLPHPKGRTRAKKWRTACHLLHRLELGLVLVDFTCDPPRVEVGFHPMPTALRKRKDTRRAILKEVSGRSCDYNKAGSTGVPLVTAYRESSIKIACYLNVFGPSSPARLRGYGTDPKTGTILYDNFYGWFIRVRRGVYELAPKGLADLSSYPELAETYRNKARQALARDA